MNRTAQVSTGIQGLDAQLGGGIPQGTNLLLLADPSNAPYMFNEQFAAGGLERKETVYYYSLERPSDEILRNLKVYLTKDAGAQLQFFDCYSVRLGQLPAATMKKLGVTDHAVNVTQDVVDRVLAHPKGSTFRLVIESLSESIQAYGLEPTLSMLRQVTGVVQRMGGLSVSLVIKGIHDHSVETQLRHLMDGVLEFGVERQGFGLYSYIAISKMRGVPDAARLLLYKETEKGLWLESTRRVF